MKKIVLIWIGKTEDIYLEENIQKYTKRIEKYVNLEVKTVPAGKEKTPDLLKHIQGKALLSEIKTEDFLILLDEKGLEFTSTNFANFLQKTQVKTKGNLIFVIGGAFGFSQDVYQRANEKLALSKMTFPHQIIRLFFAEQIYRAFTIINGEKYHHD